MIWPCFAQQPAATSSPASWAIVATIALVSHTSWASESVWLFNIWGAAALLFGFYQGQIQPGMLGAAFFIVTALVLPLLVTHALIFHLLARRQTATEPDRRAPAGCGAAQESSPAKARRESLSRKIQSAVSLHRIGCIL